MAKSTLNSDILAAALIGFEVQKTRIDAKIADIRSLLDGGARTATAGPDSGKPKRKVSAAARRRMARAQRMRWKKLKQAGGSARTAAAKPKRVLSAGARRAISAAQKARWAAKKSAQKRAGSTKSKTKSAPAQATAAA